VLVGLDSEATAYEFYGWFMALYSRLVMEVNGSLSI